MAGSTIRNLVMLLSLTVLSFIPTASARANAGPIPDRYWFNFEDEFGHPISPEGVQLVGCRDDCSIDILLLSNGVCKLPGCLQDEPQIHGEGDQLDCAGATCLAASFEFYDHSQEYRMVAQIDGQVYASLPQPFHEFGGFMDYPFRVVVSPPGLEMIEDPNFEIPDRGMEGGFFFSLLVTLFVELLVAGMYLGIGLRKRGAALANLLVLVVLADLVTFPLVWFFFPSLAPFAPPGMRALGKYFLVPALVFTLLAAVIYNQKGIDRRSRWPVILLVLAVALTPVCAFLVEYGAAYTDYNTRPAGGLPGSWLLLASEVFAVLFEAGFIYFLSRKALVLKHALLLSLLMNLASYLAGLVILTI